MQIKVLDHGFVRLVSYMQPVSKLNPFGTPIIDSEWSGDLEIVRNARVSHNADWREGDEHKDTKLIRYMMLNGHTSPFEAMTFTFEIKCPLFIARQWHRHRTWSYNEVSARYTELPEEYYVPEPDKVGNQSKKNKQSRNFDIVRDDPDETRRITQAIGASCGAAFQLYHELLRAEVPREIARSVLPLATYTRFFGTVDLHNLFHFIGLRDHDHAQYEIQVYARALLDLIRPICPVAVETFEDMRSAVKPR